ncbi:putative basic proline-rich protein-like [Iris pallida]|uniref:Basic proline-rich protein-like n=1 Tax=Iris pallida TaxID=29817 RepID=A0AAX6HQ93_IRIPA|nr:putative basic proline-rich protein-like [Iris pallida]
MCSERTKSPSPDWSLLPPELLHLIAHSHLPNPCDLLRFRSVCSLALLLRRLLRLRLLLLPLPPLAPPPLPPQVPLPPLPQPLRPPPLLAPPPPPLRRPRKTVFASPHGFLIVIHKSSSDQGFSAVSLFNPFTGALITFPPLPPIAKSPSVRKALLTVDPAMLVAVLLHGKLAFCALGDADWTVADVGSSYGGHDLAYRAGRLYLASFSDLQVLRLEDLSWPATSSGSTTRATSPCT